MKKKFLAGLAVGTTMFGMVGLANAETYAYDFTYDGTKTTVNQSAEGNTFEIGDKVTATFNAFGNDYWSAEAGTYIWTPIGVHPDSGTRIGNLTWNFSLDGSSVYSGSEYNTTSVHVHIPQNITITTNTINFDQLFWEYTLTDSFPDETSTPGTTAPLTNTLQGLILENLETSSPGVTYHSPEAETDFYALLVGVHDKGLTAANYDLRGDLVVNDLNTVFSTLPNAHITTLTGSYLDGGISQNEFENAVKNIYSEMDENDTLFLYISGHGSTDIIGLETTLSDGDEFIVLNPDTSDSTLLGLDQAWLVDDELYSLLDSTGDINKIVFLDSCHSGGFWGNSNLSDLGDLERLENIGLITSASETGNAYSADGYGLISSALIKGFEIGNDGYYYSDTNKNDIIEFDELGNYILDYSHYVKYTGEIVYQMDFGDEIIFDPQMLSSAFYKSDDFNAIISAKTNIPTPTPEPTTMLLFGTGIVGLIGATRRKKSN